MNHPILQPTRITRDQLRSASLQADVRRVLTVAALTVVAVAFVACLLELRSVRREVEELRALVVNESVESVQSVSQNKGDQP